LRAARACCAGFSCAPRIATSCRQRPVDEPDDVFKVTSVVNSDVAGTVEESGCKMTWPA
jgi:hypothetical protein